MFKRRDFIKATAVVGTAVISNPFKTISAFARSSNHFALNLFIEHNPEAVFIMKTAAEDKFAAEAIKEAGLTFGRSVFISTDDAETGFPLDGIFVMKSNLTSRGKWQSGYTVEGTMGVITDVNFVEGIIENMKKLGVTAGNIYIREVNGLENMTEGGYEAMGERIG